MANGEIEIQNLPIITSAASGDLIPIVHDPLGTPITSAITKSHLVTGGGGGDGTIHKQVMVSPPAYNTAIHATINLTGSPQVITTAFTQPGVARKLSCVATSVPITVGIVGTDANGGALTENLVCGDPSGQTSANAFRTITQLNVPAEVSPGDTLSIVMLDNFGLDELIVGTLGNFITGSNGSYNTGTFTVDSITVVSRNSFTLDTPSSNGSLSFTLYYVIAT